jgi:hypothetical protein
MFVFIFIFLAGTKYRHQASEFECCCIERSDWLALSALTNQRSRFFVCCSSKMGALAADIDSVAATKMAKQSAILFEPR